MGAKLSGTQWYETRPAERLLRESPARSARDGTTGDTLARKGVVRDVEAGGSNPLTPTTKPLVTGLREQPDQGLLSFSRIVGAIRLPGGGVQFRFMLDTVASVGG